MISVHVIPAAAARVALAHHVMAGKVNGKEFGCEAGLAPQSPVAIPSCIANASPTVSWHALIREAAHNIDIATSAVALDINTGGLDVNTAKQHCQPSLLDVLIDIYPDTISSGSSASPRPTAIMCAPAPGWCIQRPETDRRECSWTCAYSTSTGVHSFVITSTGVFSRSLFCNCRQHRRRCRMRSYNSA